MEINHTEFIGMKIYTVQYLDELKELQEISKRCFNNVSDIYESPISHSFRIYDNNKVTSHFYQMIKDE